MIEKNKLVIVFAPLILICIFSGYGLFQVLAGNIGKMEVWRVVCAVAGFIIINGMTLLFILKLRNLKK